MALEISRKTPNPPSRVQNVLCVWCTSEYVPRLNLVHSVLSSTPDTGTVPVATRYQSFRPFLAKGQGGLLLGAGDIEKGGLDTESPFLSWSRRPAGTFRSK
jgi:hypothetical protein